MRKLPLILLLFLTLLLSSCGESERFLVYCPVEQLETAAGEGAIETRRVEIEGAAELDTAEISERLLSELLDLGLAAGVSLNSVTVKNWNAVVDFSRRYADLTGIDLTLADYCVTLTLTQLENINSVTITAEGKAVVQRKTGILTAADPLLGQTEDTLRPVTVELHFWDNESETLVAQQRTLELHEGQSRVDAVLAALTAGPQGSWLTRSVPETLELLSARVSDGVCYLYLAGVESLSASAVEAIELSVLSLPNLREVTILLEGAESEIR